MRSKPPGASSRQTEAHLRVVTPASQLPSQSELLRLAQQQHPDSERLLFQRFAPDVHRVVWKLLGPDADHEDVVHDTFLQIFRTVHTVHDASKLTNWVVAVAVHTARREIRRRRLRAMLPWEPHSDARVHEHWSAYDDADVLRRIHGLLQKFPTEERIVLSLKFFERLTLDEISEVCRCSRTTVKRRSGRAQARFARLSAMDPVLRNWTPPRSTESDT